MGNVPASESMPLISVILCVFNGERQVAHAIGDILAQTYTNFELIISDDASTDDTFRVLERYRSDQRVRLFRQTVNLGVVANKNFAINRARGMYITQQDHDDRTDRTRLERQARALVETSMLISACGVRRVNNKGDEVTRFAPDKDMIIDTIPENGLPFFFAPVMFSRNVWKQHGPFHSYFSQAFGEDYYFISCVLRSYPIAVISDCLYDYVDSPGSVTSRALTRRTLTMPKILEQLSRQNMTSGTNDLEQGLFKDIAKAEESILSDRFYMAEQYRIYAARAIDHLSFTEAVKLLTKAVLLNPFSFSLFQTIFYLARRKVARIR